jgi:hypothetical protein
LGRGSGRAPRDRRRNARPLGGLDNPKVKRDRSSAVRDGFDWTVAALLDLLLSVPFRDGGR